MNDHVEENFWDDRTTPGAYGKIDSDRDTAARRASIAEPHKLIEEAAKSAEAEPGYYDLNDTPEWLIERAAEIRATKTEGAPA